MYSHLHPGIAPGGNLPIWGSYNPSKIVNMARETYTDKGFIKKRRKSEKSERDRFELTGLMALEGALTPQILNAIAGYKMFDNKDQEWLKGKGIQQVKPLEDVRKKEEAAREATTQLPEAIQDKIVAQNITTETVLPEHAGHISKDIRERHKAVDIDMGESGYGAEGITTEPEPKKKKRRKGIYKKAWEKQHGKYKPSDHLDGEGNSIPWTKFKRGL